MNRELAGRVAVVGGFSVMVVIFGISQPENFFAASTVRSILDQSAVPVILACGLTFVLVSGEFDLSYTSTLGISAALSVVLVTRDWPIAAAILVSLAVSILIGLLVGFLVTLGRASSFIVTLAVGSAVMGLEQALSGNRTIYEGIPQAFVDMTEHQLLGLRAPVWFALLIVLVAAVLLHGTAFGRQAKAVGGNPTAAYLAGVRVRRVKIACFVLVALMAGVAAIILASRSASYYPNVSAGFLLNTYAAAFLGAAIGARIGFTVAGSAFGVLWITTLQTGLTLNNQPAWTSNLIQGLVLAAAVLISARGREGRT